MEKKKHFRFSNTGNAFLLAFGLYYLVGTVYGVLYQAFWSDSTLAYWLQYAINPIAFIGAAVWYSRKKNVDFVAATNIKNKINGKQVGLLALLSVFCIMGFLPISNIFLDVLTRIGLNSPALNFPEPATDFSYYIRPTFYLSILFLAVMPALSEEILMRGVVLNAAMQKRNYSYAIVLTAAMFSLMHGNATQTVHQFFLGMVLAYVVIVSRSLWAGILLHFFNNFLSVAIEYPLELVLYKIGYGNLSPFSEYIIWIIAMIIGCTAVIVILKKFGEIGRHKEEFGDATVIDVYPDGRGAEVKNQLKTGLSQFFSIFKKGGLKRAYDAVNVYICSIVPLPEEEEMTREELYPSNIKLTFIILIIIWVLSLLMGFMG